MIKNYMKKAPLYSLIMALSVLSIESANANTASDDLFESQPVTNHELSSMRGGFLTAGGLLIDFGLNIKTLIDGVINRDITFGTETGQDLDASQLKSLIQVGSNNLAIPKEVLDSLPSIVTIIQNSDDNKVIQNINTLDIRVSNTQSFIDRGLTNSVISTTIDSLK